MAILILSAVVLFIAAVALLVVGLRGRRVGEHRYCRRCGYDLHGQPASSSVCPECGRPLTATRATIIGQRRRKPALVIVGGLILLAAIGLGTRATLLATQNVDWYHYRPAGWLVADVRHSPPNFRSLAELIRRCNNRSLSDANARAATLVALAAQKDRTIAWKPAWGDFIEAAHRSGQLADADWKTYLQQAILPTFKLTSDFDLSSPIVFEPGTTPAALGHGTKLWTAISAKNFTIDEKTTEAKTVDASEDALWDSSGWSSSNAYLAYAGRDIGPGKHTLYADVTMTVSFTDILSPASSLKPMTPAFVVTSKYTETFEIIPEDIPPPDAASRKAMHDAIHFKAHHTGDKIILTLSTDHLPMAMAVRLWIVEDRHTSHEAGDGTIRLNAGDQSIEITKDDPFPMAGRKSIDLVLKPDDNTFRRDMGGVWLWKEEIHVDHVSIEPASP